MHIDKVTGFFIWNPKSEMYVADPGGVPTMTKRALEAHIFPDDTVYAEVLERIRKNKNYTPAPMTMDEEDMRCDKNNWRLVPAKIVATHAN